MEMDGSRWPNGTNQNALTSSNIASWAVPFGREIIEISSDSDSDSSSKLRIIRQPKSPKKAPRPNARTVPSVESDIIEISSSSESDSHSKSRIIHQPKSPKRAPHATASDPPQLLSEPPHKRARVESRSRSKSPTLRRLSEPPEPGPSTLTHHAFISDEAFALQLQKEIEEEERIAAEDEKMARELESSLSPKKRHDYTPTGSPGPSTSPHKRARIESMPPEAGPSTRPHHALTSDEVLAMQLQMEMEEVDRLAAEDEKAAQEFEAELNKDIHHERAQRLGEELKKGITDRIVYYVTVDKDGKTLEGDPDPDNLAHLELVKQEFTGMQIQKVTFFVNHLLNTRFEQAKIELEKLGRDTTERTLFHGTQEKNVQPILEDGFKVGGVSTAAVNGTACGVGVYLATNPTTSWGYCAGGNRMFACRVVTGKSTPRPMHTRPNPPGKNEYDAYENTGVVVVRHPDLVLPRYVVEFAFLGYMAGMPMPMMPMPMMPIPRPIPIAPVRRVAVASPRQSKPRKASARGRGRGKA